MNRGTLHGTPDTEYGEFRIQCWYEENTLMFAIRAPQEPKKRMRVNVGDGIDATVTSSKSETIIAIDGVVVFRPLTFHTGEQAVVNLVRKRTGIVMIDLLVPQWNSAVVENHVSSAFLMSGDALELADSLVTEDMVVRHAHKLGLMSGGEAIEYARRHGYVLVPQGSVIVSKQRLSALVKMEAENAEKAANARAPRKKTAIGAHAPKAQKPAKK
ncbi:MAG: hypothetical protein PHO20_04835 [Candidatus Peribacteraceae bacterium]|nr:hypothetical protein [Candidatus Peribacteraceae bacterium]MDD5740061.1 hypothetical protein [Candidatus Peribacteraceae bacterium]